MQIIEYYENDENRFTLFYITFLSDIKLKETYVTVLLYPYRESHFNSFDNVNDFIDKVCSNVPDENFYKEIIEIIEIKTNIYESRNAKKRKMN